MADAVTSNVVTNNGIRYDAYFTNISDGTGETAVKKIDISTLTMPNGAVPNNLTIEKVEATVNGMKWVKILWDHSSADTLAVLCPTGHTRLKFYQSRLKDPSPRTDVNSDTGDILITTSTTPTSGDSYSIHIRFKVDV